MSGSSPATLDVDGLTSVAQTVTQDTWYPLSDFVSILPDVTSEVAGTDSIPANATVVGSSVDLFLQAGVDPVLLSTSAGGTVPASGMAASLSIVDPNQPTAAATLPGALTLADVQIAFLAPGTTSLGTLFGTPGTADLSLVNSYDYDLPEGPVTFDVQGSVVGPADLGAVITVLQNQPIEFSPSSATPAPGVLVLADGGFGTAAPIAGSVGFSDADPAARPFATIASQSVTVTGAAGAVSLDAGDITALEQDFTVTPDAGNGSAGTIDWQFAAAPGGLGFLAAGETIGIANTIAIQDQDGNTIDSSVTLTLTTPNAFVTVLGASGGTVEIGVNSAAAATLAQAALTRVSAAISADPAAAVSYAGSVPGAGTLLVFTGSTASAGIPAGSPFAALVADTAGQTTLTDADTAAQTVVGGAGGLIFSQTAASVAGSLIVTGGGDSTIDLAAGANTVSVDVTPPTNATVGAASVNALAGGADIIVNANGNDATQQDQAIVALAGADSVQVNGSALVQFGDASNSVTLGDGGSALLQNLPTATAPSAVTVAGGRASVGALAGTAASVFGTGAGGTLDILGGAPSLGGGLTIDPLALDVVQTVPGAALTLLGTAFGGSNTGTDTIVGAVGAAQGGSGGHNALFSAAALSAQQSTTLRGAGAADTLGAQSANVSLLGAAGTALLEASGMTVAGGVASLGGITMAGGSGSFSVAGAEGGVTMNAGAANASIFGATSGANTIISGSGASTVWGHAGETSGTGNVYLDGAAGGEMTIADFNQADIFALSATQSASSISNVSGGTLLTISDGTKITFLGVSVTGELNTPGVRIFETVGCFVAGTRIETEHGPCPVERLRVGSRVRTAAGGLAAVVWLGRRRVDCRRHPRPGDVQPVRVRAHAFGPSRPSRDLWLSPDHAVFVDGVLIPVRHLIDGAAVARQDVATVSYHHVELAAHDVVLAENLPCESFLDTGGRAAFADGGGVVQLHPDFAARRWDADACAELVVAGPRLAAVRARLAAAAATARRSAPPARPDRRPRPAVRPA